MTESHLFSEIFEGDLLTQLRHPSATLAMGSWDFARGALPIPEEHDFERHLVLLGAENLMVLRRLPDGDFVYEKYGAAIARHSGYQMTGRRLSEWQGALGTFYSGLYRRALSEKRALGSIHRLGSFKERSMWERVILPVARNGEPVAIYCINTIRELEQDFHTLKIAWRNAGFIALQFQRDEAGRVSEAVVIGANRHAMEITGRRLDELLDRSMIECFPNVVSTGLYDRYLAVASSRTPQRFELSYNMDGVAGEFEVSLAPFHDGVTIAFVRKGEG